MTKLERIILNTKPVTYLVEKAKKTVLPGFEGVPLYDSIVFFLKQIKRVGLNDRAASISFNFIMAIPALCICIFTLLPYMPVSKQMTAELLHLTRSITPSQNTYNFVNSFLEDFLNTPRGGLLSFGFLLVIYYASNSIMALNRTFDKSIYEHKKKQNFIRKRWKAIKMTVVLFGLILAVLLLIIGQSFLFDKVMQWLHLKGSDVVLINISRWIVLIGILFYGISFIYRHGPSVKEKWPTISPGSVIATGLTILTSFFFSIWVNNFSNTNKIYGSIGTVLILMLFIYLNALILLIGFEINVSITFLKAEFEKRDENPTEAILEKEILSKLKQ